MYSGLPTMCPVMVAVSVAPASCCFAKSKSISRGRPLLSRITFVALTSRWTIPASWRAWRPPASWTASSKACSGGSPSLRMRKEGLPPEQAFELAVQLAGGLQALHDAGIVHRDVKATNVILDNKGRPRLMDFDFAKQHDAGATDTATITGHIVGSPEYMSPESARGDQVDFRSDVYSLGVVVFEMFTGEVPFRGDSPLATILKHLNEPPPLEGPRAKGLPSSLLPVLRKALAKWSAERYSTAGGFAMALGFARIAFGELAPPPKVPTPPLPALLEALNPLDKTIRMQAVKARSLDTRSMRAIPALIDALEKPPAPSVVEPS